MARNVDLTSQKWCDLVFRGKNKKYGAYVLRKTSSRRHMLAIFSMVGFVIIGLIGLSYFNQRSVEAAPYKSQPLQAYVTIPDSLKEPVIFTTPVVDSEDEQKLQNLIREKLADNKPVTVLIAELGDRFVTGDNYVDGSAFGNTK